MLSRAAFVLPAWAMMFDLALPGFAGRSDTELWVKFVYDIWRCRHFFANRRLRRLTQIIVMAGQTTRHSKRK
jgi:hypothetical protein